MNEHETENRPRFNALFASYGPDIVAYCSWRGRLHRARRRFGDAFEELRAREARLPEPHASARLAKEGS
ncbi:MAG TPA: hypothetical protein VJ744_04010 [Gaiellaceae bacterium]|nr:hypothetical protein [Gaiellaceae bacterium]